MVEAEHPLELDLLSLGLDLLPEPLQRWQSAKVRHRNGRMRSERRTPVGKIYMEGQLFSLSYKRRIHHRRARAEDVLANST